MKPRVRNFLKTKHFRFSLSKMSSIVVHLWGSVRYFLSTTSENKSYLIYLREQTVKMCRHIGAKETSRREHLLLFIKSQKLRQLLAITYNNRKSTDDYDCFTKIRGGNTIFFPSFLYFALRRQMTWRGSVFSGQSVQFGAKPVTLHPFPY